MYCLTEGSRARYKDLTTDLGRLRYFDMHEAHLENAMYLTSVSLI